VVIFLLVEQQPLVAEWVAKASFSPFVGTVADSVHELPLSDGGGRRNVQAEFVISLSYEENAIAVTCAGELDVATADKLRDAVAVAFEAKPKRLRIDALGISLLTSSGIEVLLRTLDRCRTEDIQLDLLLSREARRILDLVGLWWVGVVDDGAAVELVLEDAVKRYSELRFLGKLENPEGTAA
jgi:anti-sigma B factor antagonist